MPTEITLLSRRPFSSRIDRPRLARLLKRVAREEQLVGGITVYVTGDAEIRRLNRSYHGRRAATDVLSFPAGTPDYVGDIVISYERARAQARAAGWRISDELDLLAVHGLLHLAGYDDLAERARRKMWARQVEILGHAIRGDHP